VVLNTYGEVYQTGWRLRMKLQLDGGLLGPLAHHDPGLIPEVIFFIETLENLKVFAGPFFAVTHTAIITLLGMLSTYVAVLLQTL
jgi:hypothetical protein